MKCHDRNEFIAWSIGGPCMLGAVIWFVVDERKRIHRANRKEEDPSAGSSRGDAASNRII